MELSVENILPADLFRFLSLLIAGKEESETREKVKRLTSSIGQDLCGAVSERNMEITKARCFLYDNQTLVSTQGDLLEF